MDRLARNIGPMDKEFFSSIEDRRAAYAERSGVASADIQITFHNGRMVLLDRVVEASDSWLIIDGRDKLDEESPIALSTPYHQISAVQFMPRRERIGRTGF